MSKQILWGVGLIAVLLAASISLASWTGERGSSGDPRFWDGSPREATPPRNQVYVVICPNKGTITRYPWKKISIGDGTIGSLVCPECGHKGMEPEDGRLLNQRDRHQLIWERFYQIAQEELKRGE